MIQPQRVWRKSEKKKQIIKILERKHVPNTFFNSSQFLRLHISGFSRSAFLYDRLFCSNLTKIEFYALNFQLLFWWTEKNKKEDENKLSFSEDEIISETRDINWALSSTPKRSGRFRPRKSPTLKILNDHEMNMKIMSIIPLIFIIIVLCRGGSSFHEKGINLFLFLLPIKLSSLLIFLWSSFSPFRSGYKDGKARKHLKLTNKKCFLMCPENWKKEKMKFVIRPKKRNWIFIIFSHRECVR